MEKLINKIQSFISITRFELLSVSIIFIGVFLSFFESENFLTGNIRKSKQVKNIEILFDSLYKNDIKSNITNDSYGNLDTLDNYKLNKIKTSKSNSASEENNNESKLIDINTASKTELMLLPGVGEKTALSILKHRKITKFLIPDDIMNVKGIGIKKFQKMKNKIKIKG